MRTSLQKVFNGNQKFASLKTDLDNLRGKLAQKLAQERLEQQEKNDAASEKFGNATSNVGRGVGWWVNSKI